MTLSVLLVEDNPVDELAVRAMLTHGDDPADVRSCGTLAEAVEAASFGDAPEVAVLDLHLPDAEGVEIVSVIRDTSPETAVLVLTGSGDDLGMSCIEKGAHQYLPKDELKTERLWRTVNAAQATARAQRDLASTVRDRNRLLDDVEEFLSIVAHDLRAPLRTARLYADRLTDDPTRQSMWATRLDGSLGRMDEMVGAVLHYGELGRVEPSPEIIELGAAGAAVRNDLLHDVIALNGTLTWTATGRVRCDPGMFHQVLLNLVGNALRYRHDDRRPSIVVESETHQVTTTVTVTDNGIGIDPKFWDRIFRPFERLDDDDDSDGLGLGLAAARRLLERNGGDLHVGHSDTNGTTMRIILPGG